MDLLELFDNNEVDFIILNADPIDEKRITTEKKYPIIWPYSILYLEMKIFLGSRILLFCILTKT